jgi:hypothetical protein
MDFVLAMVSMEKETYSLYCPTEGITKSSGVRWNQAVSFNLYVFGLE